MIPSVKTTHVIPRPTPSGASGREYNFLPVLHGDHWGLHPRKLFVGGDAPGLRAVVTVPAPFDQRPAGLPALPADRCGRAGSGGTRTSGRLGSPSRNRDDDDIAFTLCSAMLGRVHLCLGTSIR